MFPLKSILCPVDFSEHSQDALRWAIGLAARDNAALRVLSVVEPLLSDAFAAGYDFHYIEEQMRADLHALVRTTAPVSARWWREPVIEVKVGRPAFEICRTAEDMHADLIVMGTHGLGGASKAFFGSTTEGVMRRTPAAVIAVPPSAPAAITLLPDSPAFAFGRILAPVDFEPGTHRQVTTAAEAARTFAVPLVLLHVVPPLGEHVLFSDSRSTRDRVRKLRATEQLDAMAARLSGRVAVTCEVRTGRPADEIAIAAVECHARLVVMGLRGRNGVFGTRPGSIAYRAMCLSSVTVLALPVEVPVSRDFELAASEVIR